MPGTKQTRVQSKGNSNIILVDGFVCYSGSDMFESHYRILPETKTECTKVVISTKASIFTFICSSNSKGCKITRDFQAYFGILVITVNKIGKKAS